MGKIISFVLLSSLLFISCSPGDNQTKIIITEDPEPLGLIPYSNISYHIDDTLLPIYDSVECFYFIRIYRPQWSDSSHDSIRIHCYRDIHDTTGGYGFPSDHHFSFWGKKAHDDIGEPIEESAPQSGSDSSGYYTLLSIAINKIYPQIIESLYYIDDKDWEKNKDFYQNEGFGRRYFDVSGTIRLR